MKASELLKFVLEIISLEPKNLVRGHFNELQFVADVVKFFFQELIVANIENNTPDSE